MLVNADSKAAAGLDVWWEAGSGTFLGVFGLAEAVKGDLAYGVGVNRTCEEKGGED